ncbi:MAG: ribosome-associated translation inhibitor RaiA [Myxococcales bacterium]|nr:ribosome-associated translation inhibitor RaiA [Myxococcales bacterium]
MQLSFTFRSTEANEALKEYAKEKLERIHKYFPEPIKVHVVYSQQRGYLHAADVQITLSTGLVVKGMEASEDFFSAIDLVMAKIERQLRRYKDRIRDHKPAAGPQRSLTHRVFSDEGHAPTATKTAAEKVAPAAASPPAQPPAVESPRIIKEDKFIAEPLSVDEAIMRMNLLHESFLCFNNIETHQINVVYRRDDGTYGLIETTH